MTKPGIDELDQERAFLTGLAVVTAAYLRALQQADVSPSDALALTRDWQHDYLRGVRHGIDSGEVGGRPAP